MGKQKKKNEKILKDLSELKTAGVKVEEKPKSEYLKEVDLTNFYHYQVSPISENREAKAPYNFIP
ncbi:MAG: hypothetical protein Q8K02_06105, partial [Flavobacterium sp.]|nr:hypothetical protein [Flavobacterium sp.]